MKKEFFLLLLALFFAGCVQPPQPSATPSPSPDFGPSPSPTPSSPAVDAVGGNAIVVAAIGRVQQQVPTSTAFLAELAGVQTTAPREYRVESNGSFAPSAGLSQLTRMYFEDDEFVLSLKTVAASPHFDKTISVGPGRFEVDWKGVDSQGNAQGRVEVKLYAAGESSACATGKEGRRKCVTPSKEQVEKLYAALKSNAIEEAAKLVLPEGSLGKLLKVEKIGKAVYAGRPCTEYNVSLTEEGAALLNQAGGAKLSDLKGDFCLDDEYGFPLKTELKSTLYSVSEEVIEFQSGSYGRVKQCETPFEINSYTVGNNFGDEPGLSCEYKQKTGVKEVLAFVEGGATAQFQLPQGAADAKVYLSRVEGSALCNKVVVNGKLGFDSNGVPHAFAGLKYCNAAPDGKVCAPLGGGGDIAQAVELGSGTVISISYSWRAFEPGYRPPLPQQVAGNQYIAGGRLYGAIDYRAPSCAEKFTFPAAK